MPLLVGDLGGGAPTGLLGEALVAVDQRQPEALGDDAPDGRLAGAHQPEQSPREPCHDGSPAGQRGNMAFIRGRTSRETGRSYRRASWSTRRMPRRSPTQRSAPHTLGNQQRAVLTLLAQKPGRLVTPRGARRQARPAAADASPRRRADGRHQRRARRGHDHRRAPPWLDARALPGRAGHDQPLTSGRIGGHGCRRPDPTRPEPGDDGPPAAPRAGRRSTPSTPIEHLVGMQAQVPLDPYLALWSRLDGFVPDELADAARGPPSGAHRRRCAATIHLVTRRRLPAAAAARPAGARRRAGPAPGVRPAPARRRHRRRCSTAARTLLAEQPLTMAQLRRQLGERFPDLDPGALAYACRNQLALVQVPPRGVWGRRGQVVADDGRDVARPAARRRHHRSTTWSLRYLRGVRAGAARRPRGVVAADRVPGGPRAPAPATADVPRRARAGALRRAGRPRCPIRDAGAAPVPAEYDNVLLSHADRGRYTPDDARPPGDRRPVLGTVLDDGFVWATWSTRARRRRRDDGDPPPRRRRSRRTRRRRPPRASERCAFLEPRRRRRVTSGSSRPPDPSA